MSLEYNTQRDDISLKEYGRNIQNLVAHVKTIEEKDKRTQSAQAMTDLMRQINTALKDHPEYDQKVWDDLYIISYHELEVDYPFPMPEKSLLGKRPQRIPYKKGALKYRHYGRNIETMIQRAIEMEDPESKEIAVIHIGRLMNSFYASFNKDNLEEEVILKQIRQMSDNQLDIDLEKVQENQYWIATIKEKKQSAGREREGGYQGGKRKNFQKRRRN